MKTVRYKCEASVAIVASIVLGNVPTHAARPDNSAVQANIRTLISSSYDQPGSKVEAAPIVTAGDYAIADWVQGKMGGRALLRKSGGKWEIVLCAGDGLKAPATLVQAGVPAPTAAALLAQLEAAEREVTVERRKRFGLFGAAIDPRRHDDNAAARSHH